MTYDNVINTSNDVATSFWRNNDVIITPYTRYVSVRWQQYKRQYLNIFYHPSDPINILHNVLTHWGRDKMAAIFQTTFS